MADDARVGHTERAGQAGIAARVVAAALREVTRRPKLWIRVDLQAQASVAAAYALRAVAEHGDPTELALNPQAYLRELADRIEKGDG